MTRAATTDTGVDAELAHYLDLMDFDDDEQMFTENSVTVIPGAHSGAGRARSSDDVTRRVREYDDDLQDAFSKIRHHNSTDLPHICGTLRMLDIATITIMCSLTAPGVDFRATVAGFYNTKKQAAIQRVMEASGLGDYVLVPPRSIDTCVAEMQLAEHVARRRTRRAHCGGGTRTGKGRRGKKECEQEEEKEKGRASGSRVDGSIASFQNAIIFKYTEDKARTGRNAKAIKIFCNGTLHVTGCKSMGECAGVCAIVCRILDIVHDAPEGTYALCDFNVQLINTSFSVGVSLDIRRLRCILIEEHRQDNVSYDPGTHAGLVIKHRVFGKNDFARDVTVLIFESGEIIVTGCVCAHELWHTYHAFSSILNQNADRVVAHAGCEGDGGRGGDPAVCESAVPRKKRRRGAVRVVIGNGFKVYR